MERYLSSLNYQLLKAAYESKTTLKSQNRYSKHNQTPMPLANGAQTMQNVAQRNLRGLFKESQTREEREK
jgi:hypothetical protein